MKLYACVRAAGKKLTALLRDEIVSLELQRVTPFNLTFGLTRIRYGRGSSVGERL